MHHKTTLFVFTVSSSNPLQLVWKVLKSRYTEDAEINCVLSMAYVWHLAVCEKSIKGVLGG